MKPAASSMTSSSRPRPNFGRCFPTTWRGTATKFVQMLAAVAKSLDNIALVSDDIVDLGRRHLAYEVEDEHYELLGDALQAMLGRLLGPDFTPEIGDAWEAAYDMLARVMQEASVIPNTAEGFFGTIIRSVMTSQYGLAIARDRSVAGKAPITHDIERGQVVRLAGFSASAPAPDLA